MRNQVISTIIIALLLSTVLGLATMNHMDQDHGICPFEVPNIAGCSDTQGVFGFMTSHLNAFLRFALAIPMGGTAVPISLLLVLFIAMLLLGDSTLFKFKSLFIANRLREPSIILARIKTTDWLTLHENSPSFPVRR